MNIYKGEIVMSRFKNLLNTVSGIAGFSVTLVFGAWLLAQPNSQNLNVASWVMWTLLDGVIVALAMKGGNKKPYLFIGWMVATALVTFGMLWNGSTWQMGFAETVSMTAVVIATYLWWTNKWGMGLIACAAALFVAGIPQVVNFWHVPATSTWWLWAGSAISCVLSIAGSEKMKSLQNAPTYSSATFQIFVLFVLFR